MFNLLYILMLIEQYSVKQKVYKSYLHTDVAQRCIYKNGS